MKKISFLLFGLVLSTSCLLTPIVKVSADVEQASTFKNDTADNSETLNDWMPDSILQQCVARTLNIEISQITKETMSELKTLYIYNTDSQISNLTGLEYAYNLDSFYMTGTNQIDNFDVLSTLNSLTNVFLESSNVTDENFPNLGSNITLLDLSGASVTNKIYEKIINMTGLEKLTFSQNMNITTIEPLSKLPKLSRLAIQFCGVTDFTVIKNFPSLINLAASGQNTGRNDEVTTISAQELSYDYENQSLFIPFSIMPNRLTNFDGYQPPFTTSNSISQMYFDLNGVQIPSSRLTITEDGITVTEITQNEFENIDTMKYNARLNNPAGSYEQPEGFSFYAISSGTYLHQFNIRHSIAGGDITVKYVDEDGESIADNEILSGNVGENYTTEQKVITGYTFKEIQGNATGQFTDQPQTVTYVYTKEPVKAANVTVKYVDEDGKSISDDIVKSGNIGEDYITEKKEIAGYTFKEIQGNATGQFTDKEQTVTYVYTKNNSPVDPTQPSEQDNNNSNNNTSNKILPITNSTVTPYLTLVGFLLLTGVFAVFYYSKKKYNTKHFK